jgi:dipeptidyl aminopeptidase/acylaminoacyl peptidase
MILQPRTNRVYFLESRSDGGVSIFQFTENGARDILPSGYSARCSIHGYGGGAYCITSTGSIIFTNATNDVYSLNPDSSKLERIVHNPLRFYGDFDAHPYEDWILAIEEVHHEGRDLPSKVINRLVAFSSQTDSDPIVIASGADFFTSPRFSPDGLKICWLQWNHPDMPWTGASLFWADWSSDTAKTGTRVSNVQKIAGGHVDGQTVAATEPRWAPDGTLYYLQDSPEYRQIYRRYPSQHASSKLELQGLESVDFGECPWILACNTYAFLSRSNMIAVYTENGESNVVSIDLDTGRCIDLGLPFNSVRFDSLSRYDESSFIVIGSTRDSPLGLYQVIGISHDSGLSVSTMTTRRISTTKDFPRNIFSTPEHIDVITKGQQSPSRHIHGFFFAPHNPWYHAPPHTKPPLIIIPHGGPTSHTAPGLDLKTQYWTSRGYSVFLLNYGGSSGHGKEYRDSLNGRWGILDVDDAVEVLDYLADESRPLPISRDHVGIVGGSAGGYTVLRALQIYPEAFAGGVSYYGVADVRRLNDSTHKFESHYLTGLVPENQLDKRSPVHYADQFRAPLLLLQGEEDTVVPLEQAMLMEKAMQENGRDVKLVTFKGEGHGFRKAESLKRALMEEHAWWRKTLLGK